MVMPMPEEVMPETIQEEENAADEPKADPDVNRRKSTHASTHSNSARMAIFSTNQQISSPVGKGSTEHSPKKEPEIFQATMKTNGPPAVDNHASSTSTWSYGSSQSHNTTRKGPKFWSFGEFSDGPDVKTGRVVCISSVVHVYMLTSATQFAIAACQDEQFVFGIEDIGGLLTMVWHDYDDVNSN
jgi:hypothetical protein